MLKKFLEKIGFVIGHPRTLSHKENSLLRKEGLMSSCEVAWESFDCKHWFIRNNKTSEMRVVIK